MTLAAGGALLFHSSIVCMDQEPNSSNTRFRQSLIFHYAPQSSTEITRFYLSLIRLTGEDILVSESAKGDVCGDGWIPSGPH